MLATQPKARIFSKIVRTQNGDFARAFFVVAQFQGQFFVRHIRTEAIPQSLALSAGTEETLFLGGECASVGKPIIKKSIGYSVPSPFKEFFFCTKQKTRAPTFAY
ncbi:MAG: hypothetical protein WC757_02675 [Candidatus Paceibacterota bacterium]|jgi:hypothetical protein